MDAVIFDVDGTLCDVRPIRHYVAGPERNFDRFHNASLFCSPNQRVMEIHNEAVVLGLAIVVVTARDEKYERVTRDWLFKHEVFYDALFMRPWGDGRRDFVVKREILQAIRESGLNPVLAVDDNPSVLELWRSEKIPTIEIPGWGVGEGSIGAV